MLQASQNLRVQKGCQYSKFHRDSALVNWDIIRSISMMSDPFTRSKLCFLRRDWRADLQSLLFRHIEIYDRDQLDVFSRCIEDDEDGLKSLLSRVESFTYHPMILCAPSRRLTSADDLFQLSRIPHSTPDGSLLFPRLAMAKLSFNAALHVSQGNEAYHLRDLVPYGRTIHINEGCFLRGVTFLWLDGLITDTFGDLAQTLGLLGMTNLRTLKCTLGPNSPGSTTVSWFFRNRQALQTIILDDREGLAYHKYCDAEQTEGIKRYAEYLTGPIHAIWKGRNWWPELREVNLRLGTNRWQEVLADLQSQFAQDIRAEDEREWVKRMVRLQLDHRTKVPLL